MYQVSLNGLLHDTVLQNDDHDSNASFLSLNNPQLYDTCILYPLKIELSQIYTEVDMDALQQTYQAIHRGSLESYA